MTYRILVPVDYSPSSRAALDYAAMLATALNAETTALHAWECPPFARTTTAATAEGDRPSLDQQLVEGARRDLESFVASARLEGQPPELLLSPLTPVRAVLDAAEGGLYDLIVMGSHGRGAVGALLLGSVVQKIVELSKVPVVVVPDARARSRGAAA